MALCRGMGMRAAGTWLGKERRGGVRGRDEGGREGEKEGGREGEKEGGREGGTTVGTHRLVATAQGDDGVRHVPFVHCLQTVSD